MTFGLDSVPPIVILKCARAFSTPLSLLTLSLNNDCEYVVSNNQHGFVPNKSTTTNLLELCAYITDSFI